MIISPATNLQIKRRSIASRPSEPKPRPQSALSGKNSRFLTKFNIPQPFNVRRKTSRSFLLSKERTLQEDAQKQKKDFNITKRDKEEIYEENMKLKKQVHRIQEEYDILKGKVEASRKRNGKRTQHFELQFQKELYWTGSKSHLISGIKYQYEKLKQIYAEKCVQNEQLRREMIKTTVPELQQYINTLQVESKRLSNKLCKFQTQKMLANQSDEQKKITQYLLLQKQQKQIKLQFELKQTKQNLEQVKESFDEKDRKIKFLQKLIKDKENNEFHAIQKLRRIQKKNQILVQEKQNQQKKMEDYKKNVHKSIKMIQQKYEQQLQDKGEQYQQRIAHKEKEIVNLQDRIQYLQESLHSLQMSSPKIDLINSMIQGKQSKISKGNFQNMHDIAEFMTNSIKIPQHMLEEEEKSEPMKSPKERVQQTADKRHSKHSQKLRRVDAFQIEDIAQFIRYKMIEAKVDIKKAKNYFNFSNQALMTFTLPQFSEQKIEGEEYIWQQQYITMKQTKQVLLQQPFGLTEKDAILLARYIIEDAQGQYVYCDEGNEQKRQVVKSIIKTLLSQYQIATQQIQSEYESLMSKYALNILSALKTICPSGKVSKKKYLQLLNGLGIQTTSALLQLIIAKLAVHSNNLKQLNYPPVFEQFKQQ